MYKKHSKSFRSSVHTITNLQQYKVLFCSYTTFQYYLFAVQQTVPNVLQMPNEETMLVVCKLIRTKPRLYDA